MEKYEFYYGQILKKNLRALERELFIKPKIKIKEISMPMQFIIYHGTCVLFCLSTDYLTRYTAVMPFRLLFSTYSPDHESLPTSQYLLASRFMRSKVENGFLILTVTCTIILPFQILRCTILYRLQYCILINFSLFLCNNTYYVVNLLEI